ncbi:MAG: hypothetical protein R2757_11600 [Draconibacterium sp.]
MKKINKILFAATFIALLFSALAKGQNITVSLSPVQNASLKNRQILVPVMVDISGMKEKLGSYTAELKWNVKALKLIKYYPCKEMGFDNPFINIKNKEKGIIEFNAVNVYGGEGNVNIMNFIFEVIDESYSDQPYEIKFSAMAAAQTFNDLLPCITELKYSTKENFINEKIEDKID